MRDGWQRVMDEIAELRGLKGHETGDGSFLMLVGKIAYLVEEESGLAYTSGRDAERCLVYKEFAEWQKRKFLDFKEHLRIMGIPFDDGGCDDLFVKVEEGPKQTQILIDALQYDLMATGHKRAVRVWTREYVA